MNTIIQNGQKIIQTSDYCEINGERIYYPETVKKSSSRILSVIDGTISVNGYILDVEKKEFKKAPWWKRLFN